MPLISPSTYRAPQLLKNGHLQTILPVFRRVSGVAFERERIPTPDDDFLDLDWARIGSNRIAVLSHGLEGNTQRPYVLGMIRALHRCGWDALAWNYRGCSEEPNRKLRWYHSGETGDLHTVIRHVAAANRYHRISLIGFSLGGNVTMKYLGEQSTGIHPKICAAVALSVPCDLRSSALKMARPINKLYMIRFLRSLHDKVRAKIGMYPGQITDEGFRGIKTFMDFDNRYTAPIHGFKDADDYFTRCSSRQFIPRIKIPTLLINAKNDPFLDNPCFPFEEARTSSYFYFEAPESGGHVGFILFGNKGEYWSECRALQFLNENGTTDAHR